MVSAQRYLTIFSEVMKKRMLEFQSLSKRKEELVLKLPQLLKNNQIKEAQEVAVEIIRITCEDSIFGSWGKSKNTLRGIVASMMKSIEFYQEYALKEGTRMSGKIQGLTKTQRICLGKLMEEISAKLPSSLKILRAWDACLRDGVEILKEENFKKYVENAV